MEKNLIDKCRANLSCPSIWNERIRGFFYIIKSIQYIIPYECRNENGYRTNY